MRVTTPDQTRESRVTPAIQRGVMVMLMVLHHFLAFAPLLAVLALYLASWRAESLIGHWPRPSIDDPKYIAPGDLLYNFLYFSVYPLILISYLGVLGVPALTLKLRRSYPALWVILLFAVFAGGWLLLRSDPGSRGTWFID